MEKELFLVSIKERYRLNHPSSQKKTYHLVLDLKDLDITYSVGDCVAIYPKNPIDQVNEIVSLTGGNTEDERALLQKYNLSRINRSLTELIHVPVTKSYIEENAVLDFIKDFHLSISIEELKKHLSPLLPRFYSISSSMKHVGKEAHLTVVLTEYESNSRKRLGTCSHYLTQEAPLNISEIALYFQKDRDFTLTKESESKPIIMIGPGTGIAPFLGFMQERMKTTSSNNWLFFGERNRNHDFYYENFWKDLVNQKKLKLDLAFSRDQSNKIYVQHKMEENAKELFSWLEEGAFLFVSGDAKHMAKDVEKTLLQIIAKQGNLSEEAAKEYIKNLKKQKRYLKDVY